MFKIGEFSKMVRVSARMLRYYDKCGLLYPAETDRFTGYRMYSATQISILYKIVQLRDMGFGVEEIGSILPNFNDSIVMQEELKRKSIEIHAAIANEQKKLKKIAAMNGIFEKERVNMVFDVECKELKAVKVLSLRETVSTPDKEPELWEKLYKFMEESKIPSDAGGYSIYHDEDYKESDVDIEIAIPVQKLLGSQGEFIYKELDAIPLAATIRFSGSYEGYFAAMEKLAVWTEQNGYIFNGLIRGYAIASPSDVNSPDDYMTELQMPVKKA